jgi:preprotein translocase subunit SecA
MRRFERDLMLQILDSHWKDHLAAMDYLRQGINLRSYAQKNPKQEYKREAFAMFEQMLEQIKHDVVSFLAKVQVRSERQIDEMEAHNRQQPTMQYQHEVAAQSVGELDEEPAREPARQQQPYRREGRKIGRNEPCWCSSGKKFKHCHGRLA